MNRITAADIVRVTGGTLVYGDPETAVTKLTTDSRNIPEDALFVPIAGERIDGHQFIGGALKKGAKAVISAKYEPLQDWMHWAAEHPENTAALIMVPDTLTALQKIAAYVRSLLSIRAVGVTGSVGKTTTREMIAAALSAERKVYRTGKNYNNKLGVPITLCELSDDYDLAVLELGLNVPDELGTISALCDLSCAVITNIGVAHMEYYGNQDRLTEEKMTVTRGFWPSRKEEQVLFLCGDDPQLLKYRDYTGYRTVLYGTSENASCRAVSIHPENGCYAFDFVKEGTKMFPVQLGVPGIHNVLNALAALAVADYFGVDLKKAAEALSGFTGFSGRLERREKNGILYIDDTYNASPDSMKAGLKVLAEMQPKESGRRIAVLGDMLELGPESPRFHYEVGLSACSGTLPNRFFLCGKEAEHIGRALSDQGHPDRFSHYDSLPEMKEALQAEIQPGDIVYFKASHSMHFTDLLQEILAE
ncbi:MAG: UDP-N-acetylmuramoyl-tripeptide--D-alanyl-D-alanine ligase [Lachnospiraceae bacterium]|nr:UDP-N-acetylmuramoyl-tripeptide--D-alanyl-D-alanine ligase [Lachnospiraceae bacterium]